MHFLVTGSAFGVKPETKPLNTFALSSHEILAVIFTCSLCPLLSSFNKQNLAIVFEIVSSPL